MTLYFAIQFNWFGVCTLKENIHITYHYSRFKFLNIYLIFCFIVLLFTIFSNHILTRVIICFFLKLVKSVLFHTWKKVLNDENQTTFLTNTHRLPTLKNGVNEKEHLSALIQLHWWNTNVAKSHSMPWIIPATICWVFNLYFLCFNWTKKIVIRTFVCSYSFSFLF